LIREGQIALAAGNAVGSVVAGSGLDRVFTSIAGEVAVVAVDHGQATSAD
jgi:hypothetical protein